jgi:hypothetical protein
VVEPDRVPFADSFLPDLVSETQGLGARLVVVVPALSPESRRGPACLYNVRQQEVVEGLLAAGADIIDLSEAEIPQERFETRQHLDEQGREMLEPVIREALSALDLENTAADAPGRLLGCSPSGR